VKNRTTVEKSHHSYEIQSTFVKLDMPTKSTKFSGREGVVRRLEPSQMAPRCAGGLTAGGAKAGFFASKDAKNGPISR
jgi:hypothetical protein